MASEPTAEPTTEPATEGTEEGTTEGGAAAATEAAGESSPPPKKAARKRASTSRVKKASPAPETGESESATHELLAEEVGQDSPAEAAAPVKRTRAPRSKAAAPPALESATEDSDTGAAQEAQAPRRRSTRGRGKAAAAHAEMTEVLPEIVPGLALDDETPNVDDETQNVMAEPAAGESARDGVIAGDGDAEDAEDSAEEALPSFGLLFQAPEPVAPRRRRATSAAGAPAPVRPDPHIGDPDDSGSGDSADLAPDAVEAVDADAGDADESTVQGSDDDHRSVVEEDADSGRRSRRRGGRGRRGRSAGADQTQARDRDDADSGDDSAGEQTSGEGSDDETPAAGEQGRKRGRKRGRRGSADVSDASESGVRERRDDDDSASADDDGDEGSASSRRRRRRRRGGEGDTDESRGARARDEVTGLKGSTRLEAKKQRRREGREAGRRRTIITEAEFLARRESVERVMVVRERDGKTQIGVLEDGVLVEHYVSRETGASMIGNVYLGRVQNVLPSMEAAFVDIGKGRNAVLYAGEVNWDAAGLEGNVAKRIENALGSGDAVLVQATKDPIGHKGARLTSQISLPGRFLVYVPEASMTGISRKLPDTERARLKSILKKIVPDNAGVIVRTAAEGASEEELTADVARLTKTWETIQAKVEKATKKKGSAGAPLLLHGEPDLTVKVIRDVFNEDFSSLVVSGDRAWSEVSSYLEDVAPELAKRLTKWTSETDLFTTYRVDEQIAKALDRKVWLPSGGSLVIDRTEAMTVVDVNTGKYVGTGGNLEETVTKNNIEAAEEIVRQLRLRDIGGIIVVDFIDMVLEANRDLVVRRLLECLGRDRTKHQVAEVTSLGLVQMTRKRVGTGLLEVFSEPCVHCSGRGIIVHSDPLDDAAPEGASGTGAGNGSGQSGRGRSRGRGAGSSQSSGAGQPSGGASGSRDGSRGGATERPVSSGPTAAQIAAAAHAAALKAHATAAQTEEPDSEAGAQPDEVAGAAPSLGVDPEQSGQGEVPTAAERSHSETDAVNAEPIAGPEVTASAAPTPEPAAAEPAAPVTEGPGTAVPVTAEPVTAEPATSGRPRRKRGRVVAQAGPPGQSQVRIITAEDTQG